VDQTHVVWPATVGEKKIDFNDLLMTVGKNQLKITIEKQLPKGLQIEQELQSEFSAREWRNKDFTKAITDESITVPAQSWLSTTATNSKSQPKIQQLDSRTCPSTQKKNLIDHYRKLKYERSQLEIITASNQEKAYIIDLRKQIQETAFAIWKNKDLMAQTKDQGLDSQVISDKASYQKSMPREQDKRIVFEK
jgi:hypothetical protein